MKLHFYLRVNNTFIEYGNEVDCTDILSLCKDECCNCKSMFANIGKVQRIYGRELKTLSKIITLRADRVDLLRDKLKSMVSHISSEESLIAIAERDFEYKNQYIALNRQRCLLDLYSECNRYSTDVGVYIGVDCADEVTLNDVVERE